MAEDVEGAVCQALDQFRIELPSWGFANTGSRFGKFMQAAAATNLAEKFSDAGMVNQLTGACPTVALHAIWDLPNGLKDVPHVEELARKCGVVAGSINPNLFQDQEYKFGATGNPDPAYARWRSITCWIGRDRGNWIPEIFLRGFQMDRAIPGHRTSVTALAGLKRPSGMHAALSPTQRLLVEYKPFEPAFYHTDIADWGMALLLASGWSASAGAGGYGTSLPGAEHRADCRMAAAGKMLGGFHFNDRRYADDDLTLGSIDPYQVFRIFHEIRDSNGNGPRSTSRT